MIPDTRVVIVPPGTRGFDVDFPLTTLEAVEAYDKGYRFVFRYIRRQVRHTNDLSSTELLRLLSAGLAVGIVQHVALPGWVPTPDLGHAYGAMAATACQELDLPAGLNVWCDLEGVRAKTPSSQVLGYGNGWYATVKAALFVPGLYVGDSCGLSATQLYMDLPFQHYWRAYNLNNDQVPIIRGCQIRQHEAEAEDYFGGLTPPMIDTDEVLLDRKGGLPTMLALTSWSAK